MNTTFVRKSTLWLATLCMALMLALPVITSSSLHRSGSSGVVVLDPGDGQGG